MAAYGIEQGTSKKNSHYSRSIVRRGHLDEDRRHGFKHEPTAPLSPPLSLSLSLLLPFGKRARSSVKYSVEVARIQVNHGWLHRDNVNQE